jgi:hypothetical protein
MGLERGDRRLFPPDAAEEFVIIRVEPCACIEFHGPGTEGLVHPDFRFERPAVRPEINQTIGIIFSERRYDHEAGTQCGGGFAGGELFPIECRAAEQIHGQAQAWIGRAGTGDCTLLFEHVAAHVSPGIRQHETNARRAPEQTERARIEQGSGVDLRVDVIQRQGGIDGDAAGGPEVTETQKIHAHWSRRVGARFEFLG